MPRAATHGLVEQTPSLHASVAGGVATLAERRTPTGGAYVTVVCPRCSRGVRRIYRPASAAGWSCRRCSSLRYRSSRIEDRRVNAYRRDPALAKAALARITDSLNLAALLPAARTFYLAVRAERLGPIKRRTR